MADDRPYTVAEAAAKLGVTEQRVRQMCKEDELPGAEKKGGRWTIPGWSVRERFAIRPPKPKPDHEAALEHARRIILDLAEGNARLQKMLDDSRKSETRALQELQDAKEAELRALQELENAKLDLASYKHYLRTEKARSERLSQDLKEKKDLIARLKKQLETAERNSKMGANRPRLIRESDTDPGPEDRRRRR